METIRSLILLKAEKKNSFTLVPCKSPAAFLMFTNYFRAASILKDKEKCDRYKRKLKSLVVGSPVPAQNMEESWIEEEKNRKWFLWLVFPVNFMSNNGNSLSNVKWSERKWLNSTQQLLMRGSVYISISYKANCRLLTTLRSLDNLRHLFGFPPKELIELLTQSCLEFPFVAMQDKFRVTKSLYS